MTTDGQQPQPTEEQWHAKFLTEAIEAIAARLHALADDVARKAADVPLVGGPGRPNYGKVAADVVQEITWGVANLHMERPTTEAAAADIARAKGV